MKKTRKENIIGNPNPDGYMSVNVPNKQTIYDPNDIAKTTIKETTLHDSGDQNIMELRSKLFMTPMILSELLLKKLQFTMMLRKQLKVQQNSLYTTPMMLPKQQLKKLHYLNQVMVIYAKQDLKNHLIIMYYLPKLQSKKQQLIMCIIPMYLIQKVMVTVIYRTSMMHPQLKNNLHQIMTIQVM